MKAAGPTRRSLVFRFARGAGVVSLCLMTFSLFRFLACVAALVTTARMAPIAQFAAAAQPQLAPSGDGRAWLVFGRGSEIFAAGSDRGGTTFAPPVKVADIPKLMLGMRRGPRIAAHGANVTVTAVGAELFAFHSADAGRTWSSPTVINEISRCAREGLQGLAAASDGRVFLTWLDLRNGKMELWGAESANGGQSWGANQLVYRSPAKSICECCHPSALFDAEGNLGLMWRNSLEGARDLWFSSRTARAPAFSPAVKRGEGSWKLEACPMDGGNIIALGGGKFASVGQRAGQIVFAAVDGSELILGPGKQPVAIAQPGGILLFWQQGSDLVTARISSAGVKTPTVVHATDARFPTLVALGNGQALLAFEQGPAKGTAAVVVEKLALVSLANR
ncbi:MAG: hypothetical protein RIQ93_1652 [Verrucomicrobiota bacterium]|jgi:hypothetical protein